VVLIFSKRRADGSYQPPLLHRLLVPQTSGNVINGLGETGRRKPTPLYHHDQVDIAWRRVQSWFRLKSFLNLQALKEGIQIGRLEKQAYTDIAAKQADRTPEQWSELATEFALANGADLVGIVPISEAYLVDQYERPQGKWLIVMGFAMQQPLLQPIVDKGSDNAAAAHVLSVYNQATRTAYALTDWFRQQGWYAVGSRSPAAGALNLIPAALDAGLGELGKHGSLINRRFGSSFRLGYVLTDVPMIATGPDEFGADEFCVGCQVCRRNCPPDAIFDTKQMVRGVEKWYVDFDKCIPYFNDTHGCAICITACPWSAPGRAEKLVVKMARRRAKKSASE